MGGNPAIYTESQFGPYSIRSFIRTLNVEDDDAYIFDNEDNVKMAIQGLIWDNFNRELVEMIWGELEDCCWSITVAMQRVDYDPVQQESNCWSCLTDGNQVVGVVIAITHQNQEKQYGRDKESVDSVFAETLVIATRRKFKGQGIGKTILQYNDFSLTHYFPPIRFVFARVCKNIPA